MATKSEAAEVKVETPAEETPEGSETEVAEELPVEAESPEKSGDKAPEEAPKGMQYRALETFVGVYQHHTLRYEEGEIIPERPGKYFYDTGAPVTLE